MSFHAKSTDRDARRTGPTREVVLPWMTGGKNPMRYVQAKVRRICRMAGLSKEITFTRFRHGGNTDGADSR
jgi:hypothetical protein